MRRLFARDSRHVRADAGVARRPRLPRRHERAVRLSHAPFDRVLVRELLQRAGSARPPPQKPPRVPPQTCALARAGPRAGRDALSWRAARSAARSSARGAPNERSWRAEPHRREVGAERRARARRSHEETGRAAPRALSSALQDDGRPLARDRAAGEEVAAAEHGALLRRVGARKDGGTSGRVARSDDVHGAARGSHDAHALQPLNLALTIRKNGHGRAARRLHCGGTMKNVCGNVSAVLAVVALCACGGVSESRGDSSTSGPDAGSGGSFLRWRVDERRRRRLGAHHSSPERRAVLGARAGRRLRWPRPHRRGVHQRQRLHVRYERTLPRSRGGTGRRLQLHLRHVYAGHRLPQRRDLCVPRGAVHRPRRQCVREGQLPRRRRLRRRVLLALLHDRRVRRLSRGVLLSHGAGPLHQRQRLSLGARLGRHPEVRVLDDGFAVGMSGGALLRVSERRGRRLRGYTGGGHAPSPAAPGPAVKLALLVPPPAGQSHAHDRSVRPQPLHHRHPVNHHQLRLPPHREHRVGHSRRGRSLERFRDRPRALAPPGLDRACDLRSHRDQRR